MITTSMKGSLAVCVHATLINTQKLAVPTTARLLWMLGTHKDSTAFSIELLAWIDHAVTLVRSIAMVAWR